MYYVWIIYFYFQFPFCRLMIKEINIRFDRWSWNRGANNSLKKMYEISRKSIGFLQNCEKKTIEFPGIVYWWVICFSAEVVDIWLFITTDLIRLIFLLAAYKTDLKRGKCIIRREKNRYQGKRVLLTRRFANIATFICENINMDLLKAVLATVYGIIFLLSGIGTILLMIVVWKNPNCIPQSLSF